jgi:hypothetical protein
MQMKRWESPRREGRNDKGKRSSARQRQLKKQTQMLRKKLKGQDPNPPNPSREARIASFFLAICPQPPPTIVTISSRSPS